jgi:hypothetical protein
VRNVRVSLVVACAGSAAILGVVAAARATTQPGMLFVTKLVITDDAILIRGDKFMTRAAVPRYPRGTEVRYEVSNHGSRPFSLNILGSVTGVLRPGRHGSILVYWSWRGRFVFRARPNGPRIRIWVD